MLLAALAALPSLAAPDDRARVTALADRFVEEYQKNFPISFGFSGLPVKRSDGVDINSPADIARWHALMKDMAGELATIKPEAFATEPEWVTWQFLEQAFRQDAATTACRNELWSVSPLGWQSALSQIATIQPVGTDEARAQALARWRELRPVDRPRDREPQGRPAARLLRDRSGRALDAGPARPDARAEAGGIAADGTGDARSEAPAFAAEWKQVIEGTVWPAITRYRDYLRDEYLPRARKSPSLEGMPDGRQCYRALIFAVTTVDADPDALFERRAGRGRARARDGASSSGASCSATQVGDWKTLVDLIRADPQERFASADEVRDFTQRTYERAEAAAAKMVLTPPVGKVVLEPFPEFQQATAPGGQYLPAADDGSRPATYYYRNVTTDLYRTALQNVILHETLPGHHLQLQFLAEHGRKGNHPISRLLFFSGPGEGWATYSEDFAHEIGLYDSDRDYIGSQMSSITPMMVVDLGMQVKGWTPEQAIAVPAGSDAAASAAAGRAVGRADQQPARVRARVPARRHEVARDARAGRERRSATKFDVRAFHQVLLEDGMLPFSALDAKLDRWIAGQ